MNSKKYKSYDEIRHENFRERYTNLMYEGRARKLLWRAEDEEYYKKKRRSRARKQNLRYEFFRSVPAFKLTNSVFLFILLLIAFSGIKSYQSELRSANYAPKQDYIERFVELSSTSGDGLFNGFKRLSNSINDILRTVYKIGRTIRILPEIDLPDGADDWMEKNADEIIKQYTPWDEIDRFLKESWNWVKNLFK